MTTEASSPPELRPLAPTWLDRFFWTAWVPMAWLLPASLLSLFWTVGGGGWDVLILVMVSPVALPAYALLNLLPRRILRKRHGFEAGSTPLTVLLALHWWGLICTILFWRGTGDSGTSDSMVGEAFWWMPEELETVLSSSGLWLWLLTAAGLLVYALSRGARSAAATPRRPQRFAARWVGPILAIALPPLAMMLAVSITYAAGNDRQTDAAGQTEAQALSQSVEASRGAMSANWNTLQAQIVPLRTAITADDWQVTSSAELGDNDWLTTGIDGSTELDSNRDPLPGYRLATGWMVPLDGSYDDARTRVAAAVSAQGWQLTDTLEGHVLDNEALPSWGGWRYEDAEGYEYVVLVWPAVDESMSPELGGRLEPAGTHATITAISPEYWRGSGYESFWNEAVGAKGPQRISEERFPASEWPTLGEVESATYYGW